MKHYRIILNFILTILSVLPLYAKQEEQHINIQADLTILDSTVKQTMVYIQAKKGRINNIRKELAIAGETPAERYDIYKRLYNEYMKFDPDSATFYARQCMNLAKRNNMKNEYIEAVINNLMIYIYHGDTFRAEVELDKLKDIDKFPPYLQQKLATANLEFILRRSISKDVNDNKRKLGHYTPGWEKFKKYFPVNSWQYAYFETICTRSGARERQRLLNLLKNIPQPSGKAAMLLHAIAITYNNDGNKHMYWHYLIHSAINDIKVANREAQSLVNLVNSKCDGIDGERAFHYIWICTINAYYYNDFARSYNIITAHSSITKKFSEQLEKRSTHLAYIVGLLTITIIIIGFLCWNIAKKHKRQLLLLKKIETMNKNLQEMVKQSDDMQKKLAESNENLKAEISYRNKTFIEVYQLTSKYIEDVHYFKKSVYNLITAGKVDKARRELGDNAKTEHYLQRFYLQFDKAFLISHPDFMERFNALLRPECRITLASSNEFTPELRIYALVALGITDSISIAAFLHYSPQTIYNYRLRMRHNACVPEKDFAETVANMYK